MPDLKPCPFCGGEPTIYDIEPHKHHLVKLPDYPGSTVIECGCGCGLIDESRESVIARWNTRADSASDSAESETCAVPAVWAWTIEDGRLHAWPAPPYLDRVLLRRVVDATWITATESSEVPATEWADRIIDSVLSNGVGEPTEVNNAVRLTNELAQMRYLIREMVNELDQRLNLTQMLCAWHSSWLARARTVLNRQIGKEGQP